MTRKNRHRGVKLLRLSNGRHVARYRDPVSGAQRQQSLDALGLTTARAREIWAIEKLDELKDLARQVTLGGTVSARASIPQAVTEYLGTFARPNTLAAKRAPLNAFKDWSASKGIRDVQDLAGPTVAAWGDHVRRPANPHKPGTRNWHLLAIGAFLRWCRRRGMLPRVTDDQIKDGLRRQKTGRDPIEVLSRASLTELLHSVRAHDASNVSVRIAPFVALVLLTGMRYAEAEGLTWAEVDLDAEVIRLGSGRTKTASARVITLSESPTAMDLLRALRLGRGASHKVFPDINRSRAEAARKRTQSRFGAPKWTWHKLRRSCGSLLCSAGVLGHAGTFLVAKRLGHSLQVAERHYLGAYHGLPQDAKTLEQAAGIEAAVREVVRSITVADTASVA